RFLKEEPWDLVINTHFLPAEIIASLRTKGELRVPQVTATTDFETHRLWVNQPCDHYFTATEEGAKYLQHWGVPPDRTTVAGFTTDIDELMAVADLVVSKPGGLTTSETLARGAVMVIVNPIPGQEARNSDFLLESGAAIKVNNIGTLPYKVGGLLADGARLAQ